MFCYSVLDHDSSNEEEGKDGDTFSTGNNSFSLQKAPVQWPIALLVNEGCKHDTVFGIVCFS